MKRLLLLISLFYFLTACTTTNETIQDGTKVPFPPTGWTDFCKHNSDPSCP